MNPNECTDEVSRLLKPSFVPTFQPITVPGMGEETGPLDSTPLPSLRSEEFSKDTACARVGCLSQVWTGGLVDGRHSSVNPGH